MKAAVSKGRKISRLLSITTVIYSLIGIVPLFIFKEKIVELLSVDAKVSELLRELMPIIFISFIFESIQL